MPYQTAAMEWLFSDETTLEMWRKVEVTILKKQADLGLIPVEWWKTADETPAPPVMQWQNETYLSGHEMVGFLRAWGVRHAHIGVTSSDIIDTALALRLKQAHRYITESINHLDVTLATLVSASEGVVRLGRTHGQPATPMLLQQVFANWQTQLIRRDVTLNWLVNDLLVAKISGPVGSYLHVTPELEAAVADELGLNVAQSATQIVTRDALASYINELGVLMRLVEAISIEMRLLSHAAVHEAVDPGGSTSSTMPHKNNPNAYERLTGLSRIVNSAIPAVNEGIVQWHERDLAHSSVERTYLPLIFSTTQYAVEHLADHLGSTRFEVLTSIEHLRVFETEALTHSAQYAFQMAGLTYDQAREETDALYRSNLTASKFVQALKRHPIKPTWEKPTPKMRLMEVEDV